MCPDLEESKKYKETYILSDFIDSEEKENISFKPTTEKIIFSNSEIDDNIQILGGCNYQ